MGDKIITITEGETLGSKTMKEIGVGHMIGKTEAITEGSIEASVIVGLGQVHEQVGIEIRIRCFKCREFDHFDKRLPNDTSG